MKTFIVALPFFDKDMTVTSYRLLSRSGDKLLGMMSGEQGIADAVTNPALDLVKSLGVEPFSGGLPLFIDINEFHILMRVPIELGIPPELLVCVISNETNVDDALAARFNELRSMGFQLASDGIPEGLTNNPLFDFLDYVIVDVDFTGPVEKFAASVKVLSALKKIVLNRVDTVDMYNTLLKSAPAALCCGSFFSQPITKGSTNIAPLKINALNLLNQISGDDFDLGSIADIIGKDPSLSISLLSFINTIMPRKIDSLRNAVAILGQKDVKRWATAAISIQLAEDKPNEITKLSLIRARFAENLAGVFEMGVFAQNLFMMGLFSLLDVILEQPMEQAVTKVALDDQVRQALVDKSGELYKILEFIHAYEHARWDDIAILMVKHNLKLEEVTNAFVDALEWYKQLLDAISDDSEG